LARARPGCLAHARKCEAQLNPGLRLQLAPYPVLPGCVAPVAGYLNPPRAKRVGARPYPTDGLNYCRQIHTADAGRVGKAPIFVSFWKKSIASQKPIPFIPYRKVGRLCDQLPVSLQTLNKTTSKDANSRRCDLRPVLPTPGRGCIGCPRRGMYPTHATLGRHSIWRFLRTLKLKYGNLFARVNDIGHHTA
jgi:hypothetical protein